MKYNTIIIGAGIMGASTAYYLSKKQKNILLLDQFTINNSLNTSIDYSRVFRYEYGSDKFYTKFAVNSLKLWKAIEKESNAKLYFKCGCLLLDGSNDTYGMNSYKTMTRLNLPITFLKRKDLTKKFPQFNIDSAVLDPNGGVIEADTAVKVLISLAKRNGVKTKTRSKVVKIKKGSIVLESGKEIEADKIIITTGAWSKKLISKRLNIVTTRQEILYLKPKNLENFKKEKFPTFVHMEKGSGFYGIPIHRINAVKIANHFPGKIIHPDTLKRKIDKSFLKKSRLFLKKYIPELANSKLIKSKVCMYDTTPDEDFIIDKLNDDLILGAGFSGHGFKFAPMIGKILTDLATKGKTNYDISRFRLNRFNQRIQSEK